jgi:hypothetical protein
MLFRTGLCACAGFIGCLFVCAIAHCDGNYYYVANNPDSVLFHFGERVGARPVAVTMPDGSYAIDLANYDFENSAAVGFFFDAVSMSNALRAGAMEITNIAWIGDVPKSVESRSADAPTRAANLPLPTVPNSGRGIYADSLLTATTNDLHENDIGVIYGIRGIQAWSNLRILMLGSVLHDVIVETEADNEIIGPEVGVILTRRVGRFSTQLRATALAGVNLSDVQQRGVMGRGLVPGALNQPLYARTTEFRHTEQYNEFSPCGELRAEARYRITDKVTFALAYSNLAIGNVFLSDGRVEFRLPTFGIVDPGEQHYVVQNVYCGVEFVL